MLIMPTAINNIVAASKQVLVTKSDRYARRCRSRKIESEEDVEAYFDSVGWTVDSPLVDTLHVETRDARQSRDLAVSAVAIEIDKKTQQIVPVCSRFEFHPPRLLRGLEVTLSPRLLPTPAIRSCR